MTEGLRVLGGEVEVYRFVGTDEELMAEDRRLADELLDLLPSLADEVHRLERGAD